MSATTIRPSMSLLKEIILDNDRDLPLHAQLRTSLERLIENHFDDEGRFYSESQLIQELGVSQGTVRRALSDLAHQGLLTKLPARGTLVRKRDTATGLQHLAVFLPDYSSATVATFLTLLNAECLNRNIALVPMYTHKGERLLKAYSNLKFSPKEGSVVLLENSPRATMELTAVLEEKGYNCVIIGTLLREHPTKFVGGCNQTIIELSMQHLTELGHRRIGLLVNEPEEKENTRERSEAFRQWVRQSELDLDARIISCGTQLWEDSYRIVAPTLRELYQGDYRPTAIFSISDAGAMASIKWLQQNGYRVPEDVSVIGSDGVDAGAMIHPALSTTKHPHAEMTQAVFDLLTNPEEPENTKTFLKPTLLVRESTGPVPDAAPRQIAL
ncbi:MAG: substrate-binding domain-containing protein [Verrucomicrobiota bacterium]